MKLLNVEMYTVINYIKSRHATLLKKQMCVTLPSRSFFFFFFLLVVCRSGPGLLQQRLQSSGARWDVGGVREESQSSRRRSGGTRGPQRTNPASAEPLRESPDEKHTTRKKMLALKTGKKKNPGVNAAGLCRASAVARA